jgi:hypothetical protein
MSRNLVEESIASVAITATEGAAASTDISGAIVDLAGYNGLQAIVTFGAITSGAVTSIKMQVSDNSALSDAADVTGLSVTVADDDDGKVFVLDLVKPLKRYARVVVDRATQDAVVEQGTYIRYGAKDMPVVNANADKAAQE